MEQSEAHLIFLEQIVVHWSWCLQCRSHRGWKRKMVEYCNQTLQKIQAATSIMYNSCIETPQCKYNIPPSPPINFNIQLYVDILNGLGTESSITSPRTVVQWWPTKRTSSFRLRRSGPTPTNPVPDTKFD